MNRLGFSSRVPIAAGSKQCGPSHVAVPGFFPREDLLNAKKAGLEADSDALLLRLCREHPSLELLLIGPLSPIASFIDKFGAEPLLRVVKHVYVQGLVFCCTCVRVFSRSVRPRIRQPLRLVCATLVPATGQVAVEQQGSPQQGSPVLLLRPLEVAFNFRLDMDAAHSVFAALQRRVPFTVVGKFCARQVPLRAEEEFARCFSPELGALTRLHLAWFRRTDPQVFARIYDAENKGAIAAAAAAAGKGSGSGKDAEESKQLQARDPSARSSPACSSGSGSGAAGVGAMEAEIRALADGDALLWLAELALPFDPLCITAMLHPEFFSAARRLAAAAAVEHTLIGASLDREDTGLRAPAREGQRAGGREDEDGSDASRCRAHIVNAVRAGEAFYLARED